MNGFEAILLGIVQGLTEFLPISSSGHLILVPWVGDIRYLEEHPEFNKTFDVALHLGTLVAVVAYFRAELHEISVGAAGIARSRKVSTDPERLALAVGIGTIPAVIVGALGEGVIEDRLGEPWQIAIFLAAFGLLLAYADRRPQRIDLEHIDARRALKIGLAQALSLAPGVSRSGITITAGRFLGLDRGAAARFSFLLLAPVTAGAVVYEGLDLASSGLPEGQSLWPVVLGVVASAVSGFAAIGGLLRFVRTRSYDVFVVYRLVAAAAVVVLIVTGVRSATF
jgi:undecaprenyl-diphosphatase